MGWFIWSVATQLLLVNPVCTLVFANVVSTHAGLVAPQKCLGYQFCLWLGKT
jgi:hypothetical protein